MTKNISILCYANYCRSPVAEKLLKERSFPGIKFSSFGLEPMVDAQMDFRSQRYLDRLGLKDLSHFPRKINKDALKEIDILLCIDHQVLMLMNKKFPEYRHKFKLFTFKAPSIAVEDPFKQNSQRYEEIMKKIANVCENFRLDDFF